MSSYEVKNKPTEDLPPTKPKDRFSIITSEKSVELNVESNEFMKRNVANCYIFMSPAQRQKLISTPLRRKWIAAPKDINVLSSQKRSLKKDFLLTKSTQNLMQPNMKNLEKHRGTHLYRQSPVCLNDLKLFGSKKQYNPQSTLKGHLDGVRSLALSNDNSTLISASEDYSLKLWDIKDIDKGFEVIEPFCTLRDHKGPIFSVASANSLVYNSLYQNPANLMFSAGADVIIIIIIIINNYFYKLFRAKSDFGPFQKAMR